ncbi:hypothetical protein FSP39_006974 [Pinctada imbricata]|uniref:J domain-containing protein n=1 Tax=Pinctada imbricata TaxID=66713 RepID=A0AA88YBE6_PINIB|nr:hypothetical protein FSP39_006974 [Pinctada imbricata]
MASFGHILVCLAVFTHITGSLAFLEGLYCGLDNCYEILGVDRDSSKTEITKAYRKMARTWHPDMQKSQEKKEEATLMFQKIANAYEILRDEEQRNDYDYMLDHPDEYLANYYRYYRRRYAPKVDVRIVIGVTITIVSAIQYWGAWNNYNTALQYLSKEPKYRIQAMDIARKEGLLNTGKKKDRRSKEEIRNEEDAIVRKVIEEKMDIRGGYRRPKITDILWVQLVFSPYYLVMYIHWWLRWIWKFWIKREEYGDEEKLYIIRKFMKHGSTAWDTVSEDDKDNYLHLELWKKEKFLVWKQKQEDDMKAKLAENARYKSYRRYMKKGGPGQMTFGPE